MNPILVVDYDPSWPELFQRLRSSIWKGVADVALAIEHVGSTSVPGLAAKPVIDIDVVIPERLVAAGVERLAALGYEHRGDSGIPQRETFKRPPGSPLHQLYLCPSTSPALANHLAIRDYLRANVAAARAYGNLKKRLAQQYSGDIDGYVHAKTDFLIAILRQVGFTETTLAQIERVNQRPTTRPD